jgi:putative hydroxymethylpyrimidine transport system substrate-binding protein
MMYKRFLYIAMVAMIMFAFNTQTAAAGEKLTVLLDWFINPDHGPLFVASRPFWSLFYQ